MKKQKDATKPIYIVKKDAKKPEDKITMVMSDNGVIQSIRPRTSVRGRQWAYWMAKQPCG